MDRIIHVYNFLCCCCLFLLAIDVDGSGSTDDKEIKREGPRNELRHFPRLDERLELLTVCRRETFQE